MRRYSGQRPLYEAWSRSRTKPKRPSLLERLRPQLEKLRKPAAGKPPKRMEPREPVAEEPAPVVLKPPKPVERPESSRPGPILTWLRPKAIQFNAGRIEISLPYQIGIVIGLAVVLLVLASFRLGQMDQRSRYATSNSSVRSAPANAGAPAMGSAVPGDDSTAPATAAGAGDNLIVIARSRNKADLVPVAQHFAEYGIKTGYIPYQRLREHYAEYGLNADAVPQGQGFLLTTLQSCDNPDRPGTDGYAAKERIKKIGALYKGKAPPGVESFAPNYFSDAYGLKIR